jgi:thiol-disulfide isomerase/thioredoxin
LGQLSIFLPLLLLTVVPPPVVPGAGWLEGLRWVNARPLSAADLRGKVVLVEFWTFDCINCRRTVPAIGRLASEYGKARDVLILGIHTPELEHERDSANVRRAVRRLKLAIPVAQDNDFAAWRAFDNHYWPAIHLLDARGAIRYTHVGELHVGTAAWERLFHKIEELRREHG